MINQRRQRVPILYINKFNQNKSNNIKHYKRFDGLSSNIEAILGLKLMLSRLTKGKSLPYSMVSLLEALDNLYFESLDNLRYLISYFYVAIVIY